MAKAVAMDGFGHEAEMSGAARARGVAGWKLLHLRTSHAAASSA